MARTSSSFPSTTGWYVLTCAECGWEYLRKYINFRLPQPDGVTGWCGWGHCPRCNTSSLTSGPLQWTVREGPRVPMSWPWPHVASRYPADLTFNEKAEKETNNHG